jgi:predicted transcriptional regulator
MGDMMNLGEIRDILEATVIACDEALVQEVEVVSSGDLMSDVLTSVTPGALLLTGLVNFQVVRTAEMAEVGAVCFVRGKMPQDDVIEMARSKGLPLLATKLSLYEASGRLYEKGIPGGTL